MQEKILLCIPQVELCLKLLYAGLLLRNPGVQSQAKLMWGFVMNELALGQDSVRTLQFSPVSIIPPVLVFLTHHRRCVNLVPDGVVM